MFENNEMFSIQSSLNFAHADQVAPLEMAMRHVNTWIRLRVSAESSWALLGRLICLSKCSTLIGLCDVLRGRVPSRFMFIMCAFSPDVRESTFSSHYKFTDKIWLISINIGPYLCKMVNFDTSSAKSLKKCIFIFLPFLVRIVIIYMYSISHVPFLSSCRTNVLVSRAYYLLDLRP